MKHQLRTATLLLIACALSSVHVQAQRIAAGDFHTLSVCSDSTMMAWGWNAAGQLGNGPNGNSNVPVQVSSLTNVIATAAGGYRHSMALKDDGTLWLWGSNFYGQLGNGTNTSSNIPVQLIGFGSSFSSIAAGYGHSLALNGGIIQAWGMNGAGQLGIAFGNTTDTNSPFLVSSLSGITAIAAGDQHSLALHADGTLWSWGFNGAGQLGDGTNTYSTVPVPVNSLTGITAIAGGYGHSMALKNDGTVWIWGFNSNGQLGNGTSGFGTETNVPAQLTALSGIVAIEAGDYHSLALKNDGTIWTWGLNQYGQLGNGTIVDSNVPVQVGSLTGIAAIAGGYAHSVALRNDGTVWAWGRNNWGQLGDGTNTDSHLPTQVMGLCQIATGVVEGTDDASFGIFPNPTSGSLTIQHSMRDASYVIRNAVGQEVLRSTITNTTVEVDLLSQPDGVYVITVSGADKVITRRLIKQ